jgi:Glycosyl transferase family 90
VTCARDACLAAFTAGHISVSCIRPPQGHAPRILLCRLRYPAYLESWAYTTNLKQKMACGSPVVTPTLRYYEWWTRALKPGVHYVEVSDGDDLCDDIVAKVRLHDRQQVFFAVS